MARDLFVYFLSSSLIPVGDLENTPAWTENVLSTNLIEWSTVHNIIYSMWYWVQLQNIKTGILKLHNCSIKCLILHCKPSNVVFKEVHDDYGQRGRVVSASDSGSGGRRFDSRPSHVVIALGKQFTRPATHPDLIGISRFFSANLEVSRFPDFTCGNPGFLFRFGRLTLLHGPCHQAHQAWAKNEFYDRLNPLHNATQGYPRLTMAPASHA